MSSASAVEPPPRKLDIAPGVLKEARERVGLSRAGAWEKVNGALKAASDPLMPPDHLAVLEAGGDRPTLAEVEALAFTYLVPFTASSERSRSAPSMISGWRRMPRSPPSPTTRGDVSRPSTGITHWRVS